MPVEVEKEEKTKGEGRVRRLWEQERVAVASSC